MSKISISMTLPTGSELFLDNESFMTDLSEQEFNSISGGLLYYTDDPSPFTPTTPVVSISPIVKSQITPYSVSVRF
jgi:hypothetical protein